MKMESLLNYEWVVLKTVIAVMNSKRTNFMLSRVNSLTNSENKLFTRNKPEK